MPYSSVSEVPSNVPKAKRKQWLEVWNSAYERAKEDGKDHDAAEASAFAQANSVAGPNSKTDGGGGNMRKGVQYTPVAGHDEQCQFCKFYDMNGECVNAAVKADPEVPHNADGGAIVSATGWCNEFVSNIESLANLGQNFTAAARGSFAKFIPFVKMDAQKQEVWGVVTAEVPDKEDEVCDYA